MTSKPKSGYFCFYKKLDFSSFGDKNKSDWMILQSSPEPGYYSKANFPVNEKTQHDHHLFVIVKKTVPCFQDLVMRKSAEIVHEQKLSLHASPGQIDVFNKGHQCIRIRVSDLDHIYPLIDGLREAGIEFEKSKKVKPYTGHLQFKKYIKLKELHEGVYQDLEEPNRYFVQIPEPLEYNAFEKLIKETEFSCKFNHFDASRGALNQGKDAFDFIVIYSDRCEKEKLREFKSFTDQHFEK